MKNIHTKQVSNFDQASQIITLFQNRFIDEPSFQSVDWLKNYVNKILDNGYFIVTYLDNTPICILTGYINATEKRAFISCLATQDNLGILQGKAMIDCIRYGVHLCQDCNIQSLSLEVKKTNLWALKMYRKFGFVETTSKREGYLLMEANLNQLKYI